MPYDDAVSNTPLQPLTTLHDRGAHFVRCSIDKKSSDKGWQKTRPELKDVHDHARGGGLVGLIPESLYLIVIDGPVATS